MKAYNNTDTTDTETELKMHDALAKAFRQVPDDFRDAVKSASLSKYVNRDGKTVATARVNVTMKFFANSENESDAVRY